MILEIAATQPHYSQITDLPGVISSVLYSPQTQTLSRTLSMFGQAPTQINMEMPFGHIPLVQ